MAMEARVAEDHTKELLRVLGSRHRLLVLTHANPDPDSLASAMGLRHLARARFGMPSTFAYRGRIMRAENREMVELCGIDMLQQADVDPKAFDCVALVDTQPGFGHTRLPAGVSADIVIDHHVPPSDDGGHPRPAFRDVRTWIGATSSMVTGYLMDSGVEVEKPLATALFYGVKTDTADLSRTSSELDERAYDFLIRRIDRQLLARITLPDLTCEYFRSLRQALNNIRIYDRLVLCSLGRVDAPEMVAEVADLLLRMQGKQIVVCGGLVGRTYHVSLRTEFDQDAYELLSAALNGEGSFGGHGPLAGGAIELADDDERTLRRFERRFEKNMLAAAGLEGRTVSGLGGCRD